MTHAIRGKIDTRGQWGSAGRAILFIIIVAVCARALADNETSLAEQDFLAGKYGACLERVEKEVQSQPSDSEAQILYSRALLATGRYADARRAMTNALAHDSRSIRLRWQAFEVFRCNGQPEAAALTLQGILGMVSERSWGYRDAPSVVAYARTVLEKGADPKQVLEQLLDPARKAEPTCRDVYLAAGELALAKHDFALAAKRFEDGLKNVPDDPDLNYGLARAYAPSDNPSMTAALEAALKRNSNHVGCLLLLAEQSIDAEDYAAAAELLSRIQRVNPWHTEAWSFQAVLAHLAGRAAEEEKARNTALTFWAANPLVDHLIGRKLSQKYRFREGAAHQRQALEFDPDYLPAKAQLAQDLLRLGEETEGWKLADAVQKEDGYDVEAFNLTTLHGTMKKFTTLTNGDFILRMGSREAAIYGDRVLALLCRARSNLCWKYSFEVTRPTIVEVFPEQKDFAVRTFGMPGNPGYLGVCFGSVITATSPLAHGGQPVNWEAVLWHEFCHVVTLQRTQNRMPRWLSEGISVFEELQANPSWGQHMTPRYREMILGDELTPVSRLSGAFLTPESELHLQFAYFESALVVEFLVERYGITALKQILGDLGEGKEINETLASRTVSLNVLETEFQKFARKRAADLAPALDFERPDSETASRHRVRARRVPEGTNNPSAAAPKSALSPAAWETWALSHPSNYWVLNRRADELIERKDWSSAQGPLEQLVALFPDNVGPESAYRRLAGVYRGLGQTNSERRVLAQFAARDDEATDAYLRLIELSAATGEWGAVSTNAQRLLAVNPLLAEGYRRLGQASEAVGDVPTALAAYQTFAKLDPDDPAEAHFVLARLLQQQRQPAARREVLKALEEAPRYQAALRLLLEIDGGRASPQDEGVSSARAKP